MIRSFLDFLYKYFLRDPKADNVNKQNTTRKIFLRLMEKASIIA